MSTGATHSSDKQRDAADPRGEKTLRVDRGGRYTVAAGQSLVFELPAEPLETPEVQVQGKVETTESALAQGKKQRTYRIEMKPTGTQPGDKSKVRISYLGQDYKFTLFVAIP